MVKGLEVWIDKQNMNANSPAKTGRQKFVVESSS